MSELIEPRPSAGRHADGNGTSGELAEALAATGSDLHAHFPTHFDEPSLDYSVTETAITEETLKELRAIAARYPQARSALLPMLHLVQSVEGRVTPAGIEACATILSVSAPPRCARFSAVTTSSPGSRTIWRSATTRPPRTARSPWSTSSATRPVTTRR
jgi:hypothetical protein